MVKVLVVIALDLIFIALVRHLLVTDTESITL